jgi:hypothetical protein
MMRFVVLCLTLSPSSPFFAVVASDLNKAPEDSDSDICGDTDSDDGDGDTDEKNDDEEEKEENVGVIRTSASGPRAANVVSTVRLHCLPINHT